MKLNKIIIFLIITSMIKTSYAQTFVKNNKNRFTQTIKPGYLKAVIMSGIGVSLYLSDSGIQEWIQKNKNSKTENISKSSKIFGDGRYTLPPMGIYYLFGYFTDNRKIKRTAIEAFQSFCIAGIITQLMKFSTHRHRPNSGESYNSWDGPGLKTKNLSFPSGHTTVAFSIASVLALEYKTNVFVKSIAYSLATLTALSRVHDNAHWSSDVFVGSLVGIYSSKLIVKLQNSLKRTSVSLETLLKPEYCELTFRYKF